jgi:hypothetical protein
MEDLVKASTAHLFGFVWRDDRSEILMRQQSAEYQDPKQSLTPMQWLVGETNGSAPSPLPGARIGPSTLHQVISVCGGGRAATSIWKE